MTTVNERLAEYEDIFKYLDKDQSGFLEAKELENGLMLLGNNPTPGEIEAIIEAFNKDYEDGENNDENVPDSERQNTERGQSARRTERNKKLNFDQFLALMEQNRKSQEEEYESLQDAFRQFDKNGDGMLDRKELKEALINMGERKLSDAEVDELFKEADEDDNNLINFNELINIIMR